MEACSKLADEQSNLTADTRSQLALPTVKGASKNHDLKNIDCHTMANVLEGRYKTKLSKARIIDARYAHNLHFSLLLVIFGKKFHRHEIENKCSFCPFMVH